MKIGICGSSGVGKTTLIEGLREFFESSGHEVITEITRKLKKKGLPINDDQSGEYDTTQLMILGEHLHNLSKLDFVSDRCLIDGYIYTEYLSMKNQVGYVVRDCTANALEAGIKMYDLIFYIPIEFALENDGVRTTNVDFRKDIDQMMNSYINEAVVNQGLINIHKIEGTLEQRISQVKTIVNAKLG